MTRKFSWPKCVAIDKIARNKVYLQCSAGQDLIATNSNVDEASDLSPEPKFQKTGRVSLS